MPVNEVVYGNKIIISLTDSTVTEDTLCAGNIAYDKLGNRLVGQNPYTKEATRQKINAQTEQLVQIMSKLSIDAPGGDTDGSLDANSEYIGYIKDYADALTVETWVFTMSDGSTVEKEVTIQ